MADVFKLVALLTIKTLAVEKEKGRGRNQKANIPQNRKIRKKATVKKAHQQKKSRALSEEIEKETVRVADEFLEKAARSRVRLEKEIGRQVLGNERMAARSSAEFKKKRWKMCLKASKRQ
ncbi:hypothetical protein BBC0244_017780 [Bartonella apihabitans]|uniref:hypothetical protein n=1 Tax=Bartonella apihabitans TaxID=2750929 RepID=UPI00098F6096|nr:hypothetical protein [Bartonella apihabitans]AQT45456.1 hypothetical protein BBC0244_017780 [Bartonella apihabitans]